MGQYTISDLEKLSGIKAHTIRIWEQRYSLLKPLRTSTNIRYYDDDQLKKLLNVATLIRNGIKISRIGSMSEKEIFSKLDEIHSVEPESHFEIYINQLISAGLTYNELQFEKTFSSCILRLGLRDTYVYIIYPLLEKLGLMWGKHELNPAQEHFVSNILKQKLFTAIDGLSPTVSSKSSFVLFLPEGEDHELGLLFANYLLRLNHIKVVYLGQSVPFANLQDTVNYVKPTHLMTFLVTSQSVKEAQKYLDALTHAFPQTEIVLSGNKLIISKVILSSNIRWVQSVDDFSRVINDNQ